jgi:SRSO17 transposase
MMTKSEKHKEREALTETGLQQASLARSHAGQLSQGEQQVPTTEGMGEMERLFAPT